MSYLFEKSSPRCPPPFSIANGLSLESRPASDHSRTLARDAKPGMNYVS
jgi:hypothetical protein